MNFGIDAQVIGVMQRISRLSRVNLTFIYAACFSIDII
jgi:hypothetical protein